jgi:hypothetical protein
MTTFREKRRARRIASDEAHSWARSLRLGNPNAKSVLRALALYVNGDGECFVGIDQLADDTDLSADTVRRRLAWLEEVGTIAREAQWFDGKTRNSDGRGKRTTDLIRLLLEADIEAIERRAAGCDEESAAISRPISPSRQQGLNSGACELSPGSVQGLNSGQPSVSPRLALAVVPGPDSSNHEPESPPLPPSGGREGEAFASQGESEPEDFPPAWQGYPGREVMRRDLALAEFRKLPVEKQKLCRAAVPLYAQALARKRRDHALNMHLWIRSGGFEEFPDARPQEDKPPPPARRFMQGDELAGFTVAMRIAEQREPVLIDDPRHGRGRWTSRPLQPDLVSTGKFVSEKPATWQHAEQGSQQFAAWRDRLEAWLGVSVKAEKIWLEPYDPNVHGLPPRDPNFRLRKSTMGLRVPAPWPPRRDGSWLGNGETA